MAKKEIKIVEPPRADAEPVRKRKTVRPKPKQSADQTKKPLFDKLLPEERAYLLMQRRLEEKLKAKWKGITSGGNKMLPDVTKMKYLYNDDAANI